MSTLAELLGSVRADSPWLIFVAGVLLAGAAAVGKRLNSSQQRIGARVGRLEQRAGLERVRRLQVEAALRAEGIPLPYWPDDPAPVAYAAAVTDDDQADDDAADELTRGLPAVPPYSPAERARFAQHRR